LEHYSSIKSFVEFENPKVIVHLAAQAGVRLPPEKFNDYAKANLMGFSNIYQASLETGVQNFLYASSSSVYGNKTGLLSEQDSELLPSSYYGATKLANEIIAKTENLKLMKTRGLRLFTVYGPFGRPDMAYFQIAGKRALGKPFILFGNGDVERDFTFITDVVKYIAELAVDLVSRPLGFSDLVNLGGGQPRSMSDLIKILKQLDMRPLIVDYRDQIKTEVLRTAADTEYLYQICNYKHQHSLESGLKEFSIWFDRQKLLDVADWVDRF
jgi:UDP-glucuronate 4-epimerase